MFRAWKYRSLESNVFRLDFQKTEDVRTSGNSPNQKEKEKEKEKDKDKDNDKDREKEKQKEKETGTDSGIPPDLRRRSGHGRSALDCG